MKTHLLRRGLVLGLVGIQAFGQDVVVRESGDQASKRIVSECREEFPFDLSARRDCIHKKIDAWNAAREAERKRAADAANEERRAKAKAEDEAAAAAEAAREAEAARQRAERDAAEAEARATAAWVEERRADKAFQRRLTSAKICLSTADRAAALKEIAAEKKYGAIGGVVDKAKIYELQQRIRANDERIARAGRDLVPCANPEMRSYVACYYDKQQDDEADTPACRAAADLVRFIRNQQQ